jgi:hypothetical protein
MRVLLIEDDRATAQSIELMLKCESFNVCATDLGEDGVDLGKLYDYDIILLDLNLMYCASRARTRRGFPPDNFHARRGWKVVEVEPPSADKGFGSSTAATIATTQTLLPSIAGDTDAYMWGDHSSLKYPCNDGLTEETSNARSTSQSCASESFASINGLWGKLGASGRCW